MKRIFLFLLLLSLLLTGCSWVNGSYVYVEPHQEPYSGGQTGTISASDYKELQRVLEILVSNAMENAVIDVSEYDPEKIEGAMELACRYIQEVYPIGAYALEEASYELGTNSGRPAVAVNLQYYRSRMEIVRIRKKKDMSGVAGSVWTALEEQSARLVVLVESYAQTDFDQIVQDFARDNPQTVMEIPQVSVGVYGTSKARVVELNFAYQNSRDSLRQMRSRVSPVFEAAMLYVSADGTEYQKYSQLSGFLTERFDYKLKTSLTPSYSLLCHGVGDSRAFAEVYAAMCRAAGLECQVVAGTRNAEPWTWNIVTIGENHYHVDLPRAMEEGSFRLYLDGEMTGYVWDYSAFPVCDQPYLPPTEDMEHDPQQEPTDTPSEDPTQEPTKDTAPETTQPTAPAA